MGRGGAFTGRLQQDLRNSHTPRSKGVVGYANWHQGGPSRIAEP